MNRPTEFAEERVLTPALLVDPDRVRQNLEHMLEMVNGDASRLKPHIKTNKSRDVLNLFLEFGIDQVKCATLAEVELAATSGMVKILFCKQASISELDWILSFQQSNPGLHFSVLCDSLDHFKVMESYIRDRKSKLGIVVDINCGMSRTGIEFGPKATDLIRAISQSPVLSMLGLQFYDGHATSPDINKREDQFDDWLIPVQDWLHSDLEGKIPIDEIMAGGSPTFSFVAEKTDWLCCPGTTVFWDYGYDSKYPEYLFKPAVTVACRVISIPEPDVYCLDLGHKAIASENPINKRVFFPDFPEAEFIKHSEEHLVIKLNAKSPLRIGTIMHGIPWHICPTIALYDRLLVLENNGGFSGVWNVSARTRL